VQNKNALVWQHCHSVTSDLCCLFGVRLLRMLHEREDWLSGRRLAQPTVAKRRDKTQAKMFEANTKHRLSHAHQVAFRLAPRSPVSPVSNEFRPKIYLERGQRYSVARPIGRHSPVASPVVKIQSTYSPSRPSVALFHFGPIPSPVPPDDAIATAPDLERH